MELLGNHSLYLVSYFLYMYNCNMFWANDISFEWDEAKAASNLKKHGVSFDEAASVFDDPYARVIADPDHSAEEERFVILGNSIRANLLTVCHCHREAGGSIRIISAREATKREAKEYWRYRHEE